MRHRVSRRTRLLSAVVAPIAAFAAFSLTMLSMPGAQAAGSTLKAAAESSGHYFGTALATAHLGDSSYANLAAQQFDMVTPENEMKWDTVESSQNNFNFGPGDQIVNFAQSHNQRVRGHNLVWHSQLPGWVSSLPSSQVKAAMENHITKEVSHFKGEIYAWDVVNEPFDDNGNLRQDAFYNAMGSGYIADALRTAHAADPNAKLYLNDYNIEGMGAKSDAMYNLASSLVQQGVPLDGIGFETHLAIQYGFPNQMQQNMQRFADLGLDVAITELDVRMQTPPDASKVQKQDQYYTQVVDACLAVSRCVGISVWGISDNYSWIPGTFSGQGSALLYDDNYQPKSAYTAVLDALGGAQPTTQPTTGGPTTQPTTSGPTTQPTTSGPTSQPTTQGPPPGGGGCTASYDVVNQWPGGFQAQVTVHNGSSARSSWTVSWTFPNGQTITQLWNGDSSQSGSTVTVHNVSYNGNLGPNASTTFGFLGSWNGSNGVPSSVSCQ